MKLVNKDGVEVTANLPRDITNWKARGYYPEENMKAAEKTANKAKKAPANKSK